VQVYNKLLETEIKQIVAEADIMVRQGNIDGALELCRSGNPLSTNYHEIVDFLNRLDAEAAAAEAAAWEQEMRQMDTEQLRQQTVQAATVEGVAQKEVRAETAKKRGKSLGEWLFGL
jgi:hypothetical protein